MVYYQPYFRSDEWCTINPISMINTVFVPFRSDEWCTINPISMINTVFVPFRSDEWCTINPISMINTDFVALENMIRQVRWSKSIINFIKYCQRRAHLLSDSDSQPSSPYNLSRLVPCQHPETI